MAFFPNSVYNSEASFTPLFRLLDEFDNYSREAYGTTNNERPRHRGRRQPASFQPKFDARETDVAFELYGEFPGLERDKINIEFTEPQTLVIRGRSERTYASPSAGSVDNGSQQQQATDAITEKGEENSGEVVKNNNKATTEKYWLQERTIGDFTRVFNFPVPVNQDAVSARLHNGILSVVVPKARKHEGRRIAIN